jgi:hypothetical protein
MVQMWLALIEYHREAGGDDEQQYCQQGHNEQKVGVVIVNSDAVVKPGTVVVEPFHASVANGTMLRARGPQHFAVRTHLARMHFRQQLDKG